jgi:dephospho-CoA kinase
VVSLVLGLTGPNASGKGEVAAFFATQGYVVHSLSDVVRDEAARQGLPPEREHLILIGNELRQQGGPGALAQRILPRLGGRSVVDSIRNPAEVEVLRRLPRFVLIGVQAGPTLRFERTLRRARPGDPTDVQAFAARERQENAENPTMQQLDATFRLADRVVENERGLTELHAALRRLLDDLERP